MLGLKLNHVSKRGHRRPRAVFLITEVMLEMMPSSNMNTVYFPWRSLIWNSNKNMLLYISATVLGAHTYKACLWILSKWVSIIYLPCRPFYINLKRRGCMKETQMPPMYAANLVTTPYTGFRVLAAVNSAKCLCTAQHLIVRLGGDMNDLHYCVVATASLGSCSLTSFPEALPGQSTDLHSFSNRVALQYELIP